jgi:glutathione reductase (NADPH)
VIVGRGKALAQFEHDLVKRLVEHTRELGVEVHLGTEVTAVERKGDQYLIRANAGRDITVTADLVVHGAGRLPNTAGLGLDTAEVATEANGGLQVTEYLQSPTNARVYAAGDAAAVPGAMPLTPVAGYEGGIVASNLLQGNSRTPDYRGIPSVVFTVPPLAGVGLTEEEVRREGLDVQVETGDASGWYSNRRVAEPCAGFKSLVDEKTDRILGMHLLGHHAEEVINLFALAIRNGLTAKDLRHQLYAYPTVGSDVPYML